MFLQSMQLYLDMLQQLHVGQGEGLDAAAWQWKWHETYGGILSCSGECPDFRQRMNLSLSDGFLCYTKA